MNFLERFYGLFASSKREVMVIKLNGERQDDGYMFIYSPDLKGFSLMLAPEQSRNTGTLLAAIHDPLVAYMGVYCRARNSTRSEARVDVRRWEKIGANSYTAQLCPC
jgi:hypothetical protein